MDGLAHSGREQGRLPPPYTAAAAAAVMGGEVVWGNPRAEFRGASFDSRQTGRGEMFFALKGERTDGHLYLAAAAERGASCILVAHWDGQTAAPLLAFAAAHDAAPDAGTPLADRLAVVKVSDTIEAAGRLACHHRCRYQLPVIGVTGSVGKTTAKDMAAHVLERHMDVLVSEGNLNSDISLPAVLLRLDERHQAVLLEMGTRGFGQLEYLAGMALPSVGIVTTVAPVHIETLGSLAGVARAKAELLRALPPDGVAIFNGDSPDLSADIASGGVVAWPVSFGFGGTADVRAEDPVTVFSRSGGQVAASLTFRVTCRAGAAAERLGLPVEQSLSASVPYPGSHNVLNVLAASLAAAAVGMPLEESLACLGRFRPRSAMRLDITTVSGRVLIDDAYNANLLSMTAALEVLAGVPIAGKRVAVLADMLELGPLEAETHRELGRQVVRCGVDTLVCIGPASTATAQVAMAEGMAPQSVHWLTDRRQAAELVLQLVQPGDAVLVKGSRGMALEHLVRALRQGWQA